MDQLAHSFRCRNQKICVAEQGPRSNTSFHTDRDSPSSDSSIHIVCRVADHNKFRWLHPKIRSYCKEGLTRWFPSSSIVTAYQRVHVQILIINQFLYISPIISSENGNFQTARPHLVKQIVDANKGTTLDASISAHTESMTRYNASPSTPFS